MKEKDREAKTLNECRRNENETYKGMRHVHEIFVSTMHPNATAFGA